MPDKKTEPQFCKFVSVKIDEDVLRFAKSAAALDGFSVQDWLSNLANAAAAKTLKRPPLKRKPPKPRA